MAEELARGTGRLQNTVRFAWWSAEEFGLLGAEAYVDELKTERPEELERIALNLDFDMIGSPNYGRFTYDGDNTAFPVGPGAAVGPAGSGEIERLPGRLQPDGPGLRGPAVQRSQRRRALHRRGDPGRWPVHRRRGRQDRRAGCGPRWRCRPAVRPCYHQLCDKLTGEDRGAREFTGFGNLLGNINLIGLDEMSDAAATALYTFARRDLDKQPLVDPAPRMQNTDGINEGGGLHADHDDHEPVASSSCLTAAPPPPGGGAAAVSGGELSGRRNQIGDRRPHGDQNSVCQHATVLTAPASRDRAVP